MIEIKNNKLLYFILFLTLFVIIEGLICQPNIGTYVLPGTLPSDGAYIIINLDKNIKFETISICKDLNFLKMFWLENGFVENIQSLFLLFSILILIRIKIKLKKNKILNIFLLLKIIALIFYLGEEISWGQHFFNWETSEWFIINNNQKETNLHNITNLLDQLPRTIVLIWCSLSIFVIILFHKFNLINETVFRLVCPNRKLLIISIILIFLVLPDLVVDKLNLHPGWTDENGIRLSNNSYFYDILTFNFVRLSELQELIFCSYFLYYSKLLLIHNQNFKN
ncbi:hypothetical protein OAM12_00815 [Candidatus Pelagibacter sp.]|nr:hypothetical protein [Candidatus Pelagibacter sp.]